MCKFAESFKHEEIITGTHAQTYAHTDVRTHRRMHKLAP